MLYVGEKSRIIALVKHLNVYLKNNHTTLLAMVICKIPTHLGDILVEFLDLVVVLQNIQDMPVHLPQELHPGRQNSPVSTVLAVLTRHCRQHQTGMGYNC